ncbi:MAG: hypothetical protein ICV80_10225 [Microcoleus sp. T1-bin1]|nr:hypothetical protein [Microcoleus sp. T1-bin1]
MIGCPDSTVQAHAFSLALPDAADRPQPQLLLPKYAYFTRVADHGGSSGVTIFSSRRGGATRIQICIVNTQIDYFLELQIVAFN